MKELLDRLNPMVKQWHLDRDTVYGSTVAHQYGKLSEEAMDELATAILQNAKDMLEDAVGDSMVVLNCMVQQIGYQPEDLIVPVDDFQSELTYHELSLYLMSSFGAIFSPIARGKSNEDILEAMQHFYTNLCVVAFEYGLDPAECYRVAWEGPDGTTGIQHRKGKMIGGCFVKESDL